jgi:hypothetical protein
MKNVQVIDGAVNCTYHIFAFTDEQFALIFPEEGQDIEFIEDVGRRLSSEQLERAFSGVSVRRAHFLPTGMKMASRDSPAVMSQGSHTGFGSAASVYARLDRMNHTPAQPQHHTIQNARPDVFSRRGLLGRSGSFPFTAVLPSAPG